MPRISIRRTGTVPFRQRRVSLFRGKDRDHSERTDGCQHGFGKRKSLQSRPQLPKPLKQVRRSSFSDIPGSQSLAALTDPPFFLTISSLRRTFLYPISTFRPLGKGNRTDVCWCTKGEAAMALQIFNLSDKVALITGGSKGLGKAMARGLAEAGADIVISSRHENELRTALDDIVGGTGRRGCYVVADLSRREDVSRLAKTALEKMGRVDILVNNAGTNKPQAIDQIRDEDWNAVLELNVTSVMALTRALVPQMKARRWGRIIHISSVMAFTSKEGRNVYSASKAALVGLAHASALDLGAYGITVNCIAPGPFLTDLPAQLLSAEEKAEFARRTALGRWGDPKELIGPVLLLASDAGSYLTGETLVVDGGYLAR
jgi:NAD(P)-dependent dehydrogenase (short-subunit alcohol dehydrogenase family)